MRDEDLGHHATVDMGDVMAVSRAVGLLLRRVRENQAMLQSQVAELCGISASVLCRLESAYRQPRLTVLLKVSSALGVRLSDVLRAAEDEAFPAGLVPWSDNSAELISRHTDGCDVF